MVLSIKNKNHDRDTSGPIDKIQSLLDKYGKEKLINAAKFCTENRLLSANTTREFLEFSEFPKPEIRQVDK